MPEKYRPAFGEIRMYWIPSTSFIFTIVFGRAHSTNKWKALNEIPISRPISTPNSRHDVRHSAQESRSFLFRYHSVFTIPKSICVLEKWINIRK